METGDYARSNANRVNFGGRAGINRQALHCLSVQFVHTHTKLQCEIKAPLPADMEEFIKFCAEGPQSG
jgi:23S rRNA-/tRNA-specific pseudouridylate synthase